MSCKRLRNIFLTLNNWTVEELVTLKNWATDNAKYAIIAKETGKENQVPHLHAYIELHTRIGFNKFKKIVPRANIQSRKGTPSQAREYVTKEDTDPWEIGEISKPGQRTDINELKELIVKEGLRSCYEHNFGLTCRIRAGLKEYNMLAYNTNPVPFRHVHTCVYWGDAGTGKTRLAYEENPSAYPVPLRKDKSLWFDGYDGQEALIIDDFYGGCIHYPQLLRLLDGYKYNAPVKGGFVPGKWTKIVITSNQDPRSWYPGGLTDALKRRLNKIVHFNKPLVDKPLLAANFTPSEDGGAQRIPAASSVLTPYEPVDVPMGVRWG